SALIAEDSPDRYYVAELSSFQLEGIETFRPRIAALLNLAPDHQDRYDAPPSYYRAKARIFENQTPADFAILNRDADEVWRMAAPLKARVFPFSHSRVVEDGAFLADGRIVVRRDGRDRSISAALIPLFGTHNLENVMVALLIADLCGVPLPRAERALASFRGLPHRLEKVRSLDGATWYNDSKATNVHATLKSLESFPGKIVLILGGKDKGGDFTQLVPLVRERVVHLVLMGKARDVIAAQIGSIVPTVRGETTAEAVAAARERAPEGGVVLLAPACASFDQYTDFEARGEDFRRLVLSLTPRA